MPSSIQFGRSWSLLLSSATDVLNLSSQSSLQGQEPLRMRAEVNANDVETPNTAAIRVYNLGTQATNLAIAEFSKVQLSAGYGQNIDLIFSGTVKQFKRGKERNVDSYLDIYAADGDTAYNFGLSNTNIAAGATGVTQEQIVNQLAKDMGVTLGQGVDFLHANIVSLPRGKVLFGMSRNYMRDLANSNQMRWSIQNGQLTLIPLTGYLPGDAVVVNSATGMIGIPEATDQGITVTMLLNPKVRVGQLLQINNADITQSIIKNQYFPGYTNFIFSAPVSAASDGLYRVIVAEHSGDSRDQDWYTTVICLLVDRSATPGQSIAAFG